jgi:predicted permease
VPLTDLAELRRQSTTVQAMAGHSRTTRHLEDAGGSERLTAIATDSAFFTVLGVDAMAGRTFREDDTGRVAVISDRLWEQRFQRSPAIIGSTIMLVGQRFDERARQSVTDRSGFVVLGVMPPSFQFPYSAGTTLPGALPEARTDVWFFDDRDRDRRVGRVYVTGRLRPDATVAAASAELNAIEQRLDVTAPSPSRPLGMQLTPLHDVVLGPIADSLWLLFGAVALVLAAACANVANLLLARTATRAREMATRAALGAGRGRLIRQALLESFLLSIAGGALGALVARWSTSVLVALGSAKIPRAHEVALDWQVFAFLFLLCTAAAVLFGLAPAIGAARADPTLLWSAAGGRATLGRGVSRLRDGLVVIEVAFAFLLALGAAAVFGEIQRLRHTATGMNTDDVVTLHLTPRARDAEYLQLEARVAALPGVESAGWIQLVPLQNWGWIGEYGVRGRPPEQRQTVELRTVTPGYFRTLGIPLIAGRELTPADVGGPPAILVNEALVRRDFANENPIGRETDRGVIVGVVGDVRQVSLDQPPFPEIYQPLGPSAGIAPDIGMSLLVRAPGPRETLVAAVRQAAREVNPALAIFNVRSMSQVVEDSVWELNLYRWLIGLFASLAIALAVIGLYAVIAYGVATRTREFAIRVALGSDQRTLTRLVVGRGLLLTGIGVVTGGTIASWLLWATPALASTFRLEAATSVVTITVVVTVALFASAVPAMRLRRLQPSVGLRAE